MRSMMPSSPLLSALLDTWALSDKFFDVLPVEHYQTSPIALRNPFIFYLGHLPAFAINTINKTQPPIHVNERFEHLFSRGRDPDTDNPAVCHEHPDVPDVWPTWEEVLHFRDQVRRVVTEVVGRGDVRGDVVRLLAEHEIMHVETLYYMLAQMNERPARVQVGVMKKVLREPEWVVVPSGKTAIGRATAKPDFDTFAWDNEFHPGVVHVPQFEIMRHAVTISSFMAFIQAGGYRNKKLWLAEDWKWINREAIQYPATWRLADGVFHIMTNNGPSSETAETTTNKVGDWPVSLSLAEARAYARWVGGEIPSEAQWMRAAGRDDETWAHSLASSPTSVYRGTESWCGVVGMIGNGWEWTKSVFDTFEGFKPTELYQEYSQDFFDGKHFVIKGGSWATHPLLVRPSFRNFYQARYPFVFSKVRLVRQSRIR